MSVQAASFTDLAPHVLLDKHAKGCVITQLILPGSDEPGNVLEILFSEKFGRASAMDVRQTYLADDKWVRVKMLLVRPEVIDQVAPTSSQKIVTEESDVQTDFNKIVEDAVGAGASDIHIKVKQSMVVEFRIAGRKEPYGGRPADHGYRMVAMVVGFLNSQSDDPTYQKNKRQSGAADRSIGDCNYRLRIESFPIEGGIKMVMRIAKLDPSGQAAIELENAGYLSDQILQIRAALMAPSGAIIMAGGTGSGKTTTMQAMMSLILQDEGLEAVTVENPVELLISRASQISITQQITFGDALKAAMRADPDVIMVGEIRDVESAKTAVAAAITGHKFVSTVHSNSPLGISTRFDGWGISRDVLGSPDFYRLMMYQTLTPHICNDCSLPFFDGSKESESSGISLSKGKDSWHASIGRWEDMLASKPTWAASHDAVRMQNIRGCSSCNETGMTRRRSVVSEVITPDAQILKHIRNKDDDEARRHWIERGGITRYTHITEKVIDGGVCPLTAERKVGAITHDIVSEDGVIDKSELSQLGGFVKTDMLSNTASPIEVL